MRNPWVIAQLAIAAVLLVITVVGFIGLGPLGLPLALFSDVGNLQAVTVFPGLVLSLMVNAYVMGGGTNFPAPNTVLKVLLGIEFALIALLLVFQFFTDEAGNTFGFAILVWPIAIAIAVAVVLVALVRRLSRSPAVPGSAA